MTVIESVERPGLDAAQVLLIMCAGALAAGLLLILLGLLWRGISALLARLAPTVEGDTPGTESWQLLVDQGWLVQVDVDRLERRWAEAERLDDARR